MITSALLALAVGFVAIGVHTNNCLLILLGGFICGVYNSLINKKTEI